MKFAISVVLIKCIPNGHNIQNYINIYQGVSKEEAMGKAYVSAKERCPEHDIFNMAIVEI